MRHVLTGMTRFERAGHRHRIAGADEVHRGGADRRRRAPALLLAAFRPDGLSLRETHVPHAVSVRASSVSDKRPRSGHDDGAAVECAGAQSLVGERRLVEGELFDVVPQLMLLCERDDLAQLGDRRALRDEDVAVVS